MTAVALYLLTTIQGKKMFPSMSKRNVFLIYDSPPTTVSRFIHFSYIMEM